MVSDKQKSKYLYILCSNAVYWCKGQRALMHFLGNERNILKIKIKNNAIIISLSDSNFMRNLCIRILSTSFDIDQIVHLKNK